MLGSIKSYPRFWLLSVFIGVSVSVSAKEFELPPVAEVGQGALVAAEQIFSIDNKASPGQALDFVDCRSGSEVF